jgi:hypothetical protein
MGWRGPLSEDRGCLEAGLACVPATPLGPGHTIVGLRVRGSGGVLIRAVGGPSPTQNKGSVSFRI